MGRSENAAAPRRAGHAPRTAARHRSTIYDRRVSNDRLVYSSDDGDRRPRERSGKRGARHESVGPVLPDDGVVRVFREKGGRGGKTVTVVRGLPVAELAAVASDLKRFCGSGGSVKSGAVELQGDHREKIAARLTAQGRKVKLAGG
jgi:translation initiation factor 1